MSVERKSSLATLREIEAESGIDITTLYRLCAPNGDLPCIRLTIGGTAKRRTRGGIRVKWIDWDAWVEQHRSAPRTATPPPLPRALSPLHDLPGSDRYAAYRGN